ncbi:sodium-coupled monocarboxylate transporter 1-like isoform X2 [Hetaerina americana]
MASGMMSAASAFRNGPGHQRHFGWQDYTVFGGMLVVCSMIGVYHGINWRQVLAKWFGGFSRAPSKGGPAGGDAEKGTGGGGQSSGEFLTGNGNMSTVPVALSMLASFLSSITLMGQPAEVYMFGTQMWMFGLAAFFVVPIAGYVFVPLFHKLRVTSAYEYFGLRFNRWVQLMASLLFSFQMVLYLALVLYAPALALHQVTGISTEIVVTVMYVVCIFYTTLGGMKAVVWTDTFQVAILYGSMVAVLIKGTIDLGGIATVWERNEASGRNIFFNWNPDPTDRYTIWSVVLGVGCLHIGTYGANQLQVQRYLSVATVEQARTMLWINATGWTLVSLLTVYAGMLIYAAYYDCDPLLTKVIQKPDQLFPLFVMDSLGDFPGFPGLFVSGIFSAGLSTVSTGVNSLAAIWFAELTGGSAEGNLSKGSQAGSVPKSALLNFRLSERASALTVKALALGFGLLSYAVVFLVPYMGGLVPVAISLSSFFTGSLLGVFILGMFVPAANSVGAAVGLLSGVSIVGWMTAGGQISVESGYHVYDTLPTNIDGCASALNITIPTVSSQSEEAFALYRVSYLWHSFLSTTITFGVGVLVSLLYTCLHSDEKPAKEMITDDIPQIFKPSTPQKQAIHVYGLTAKVKGATTMEEEAIRSRNQSESKSGIDNPTFDDGKVIHVEKYTYTGDSLAFPR